MVWEQVQTTKIYSTSDHKMRLREGCCRSSKVAGRILLFASVQCCEQTPSNVVEPFTVVCCPW
jgi:hypothetical protein